MSEPWLGIIGRGLAAAFLTTIFNVIWDWQKKKLAEDWEFRRYHANMVHIATVVHFCGTALLDSGGSRN